MIGEPRRDGIRFLLECDRSIDEASRIELRRAKLCSGWMSMLTDTRIFGGTICKSGLSANEGLEVIATFSEVSIVASAAHSLIVLPWHV